MRLYNDSITCSTCHNQHNGSAGTPHLRVDNTGDAICKDCHSSRHVGIYRTAPATNKGSHPVGVTYDGGDSRFNAAPTPDVIITAPLLRRTEMGKLVRHLPPELFANGDSDHDEASP